MTDQGPRSIIIQFPTVRIATESIVAFAWRAWRVWTVAVKHEVAGVCVDLELLPLTSGPDLDLTTLPAVAVGVALEVDRGNDVEPPIAVLVTRCETIRRLVENPEGGRTPQHGARVHGCDALRASREALHHERMQDALALGIESAKRVLGEMDE